jgi:PKHD-type hydroxylase
MSTYLSFNPKELADITYPFCWYENTFTEDELAAITNYCSTLELSDGVVVGGEGESISSNSRQSKIKFIDPDTNNLWMFEKFRQTISSINDRFYGLDLTGFDAIQYTEYGTKGARYDWHMDTITGPNKSPNMVQTRKLSITMPLNDPSEYEGGEFQIQAGLPDEPLIVEQKPGKIIAFPSFMIHRVTPVTRGVRKSLVIWCVGPKFK